MTTTQQIMTKRPITCSVEACINDAAHAMWEHDVGMLPVVDEAGRVIGTLTDRDVAMAAYTQGRTLSAMTVRSAMSHDVRTASPETLLSELEHIMAENQVRRIPVVDDDRRLVGLVSLGDLARYASKGNGAAEMSALAHTLRAVTERRTGPPNPSSPVRRASTHPEKRRSAARTN